MASSASEGQRRGSAEFVESSILEVIVPSDPTINLDAEIGAWDGKLEDEGSAILPFVSQRQFLLFVPLLVVLRTPQIDQSTLRAYISRLAISLEAFVFSTAPPPVPEARVPPPKEPIYSETIKESSEPRVIGHEGESHHAYVVWRLEVFISRPRARHHKPTVYFQPTASLKPAPKSKPVDDDYLPSGVPTPMNLLQSFDNDPALAGVHPRLSAMRISKVVPTTPLAKELVRPIRTGQRRLFRALSALIWRVRYSRMRASMRDASIIASLDLEVAHIPGCRLTVDAVELALGNGQVQPMAEYEFGTCVQVPGDQVTYVYKLTPDLTTERNSTQPANAHVLSLRMKARVMLANGPHPDIDVHWKTAVDFAAEHDADLVKAAQRLSNPNLPQHKAPNPDALPQDSASQQGDGRADKAINVVLTITGPWSVKVGDMFNWDVFVVNRSEKTRKLAVLVLPKRKRDYEKHISHPSVSSVGGQGVERTDVMANAVVDENIIYAKQKHAKMDTADLLCLTTDVRIGHLAPGACYTAQLKFVALSEGVLGVEAVRVVDLSTQEAADIRDLPTYRGELSHQSRRMGNRIWHWLVALAIYARHNKRPRMLALDRIVKRGQSVMSCSISLENTRRRLLYQLNRRWIYGKIPLLHAAVFLLQMAAVSLLTRKFNSYYAQRPVLTTMITNAILGGIADTVAQSLTAIRQRAARKSAGVDKDGFVAIEIDDLHKRPAGPTGGVIPDSKLLPPPFDFERLTRFMAYGFLMAPVQHKWFSFLSRTFPVSKTAAFVPALKRVAFDQFLFAPFGLACFFTFMTVAEGGGKRAVQRKFQDVYVPSLKANYMVWPAVQIINFRIMPIQFQIPFVSTVGIAWTAYLSLTNAAEDESM
ncbi:uncharacterized protein EI97DRAFT_385496 [Westerdykella ornata]|uniref:Trafficking protein particle complex II-specific subunit 65 IgD3 domain-containing protein n=1 Tax=Westerdykella ornata TaxID=318751 RepID=A0A6A6J7P0_WESOR|nr:uncharacterized protein EI97DRAFT_385496 [Westerdykella ornata]KAF2272561.1 hypothetical protein EI97DRAFT_385496 [Westerdykella ornata]